MGWYSQIQSPLLTKFSIWLWTLFAEDLRLQDAKKQHFTSLGDCFTRELKDGLRPIAKHPERVISPCDAIIGEYGDIHGTQVFQANVLPFVIS